MEPPVYHCGYILAMSSCDKNYLYNSIDGDLRKPSPSITSEGAHGEDGDDGSSAHPSQNPQQPYEKRGANDNIHT